jgi:hypothetical protein
MEFLIRIDRANFPIVVDDEACIFKTSLLVPPTTQKVIASLPSMAEVFRYRDVSLFSPYCYDAKERGDFEVLGNKDRLSLFQESEPYWFLAVMPAKDGAWLLELGTVEKSCLDVKVQRLSSAEAERFYPVLHEAICYAAEGCEDFPPDVEEVPPSQVAVAVTDTPLVTPRDFRLPVAPEPLFVPDLLDEDELLAEVTIGKEKEEGGES